jgi:hypothetical protein
MNINTMEVVNKVDSGGDMLAKIFLISVGPDVGTFKDTVSKSDTQRWYMYSYLERYLAGVSDGVAQKEMQRLQTQFMFPTSEMMKFSRFNPKLTVGSDTNSFGLDESKLAPYIVAKLNKKRAERDSILKGLSSKGIDVLQLFNTTKQMSLQEAATKLNNSLSDSTKKQLEDAILKSNGKPDVRDIARIIATA